MSIDHREHNPVVMTTRGKQSYVGTFGEDQGKSELAVFDQHFSAYALPFASRTISFAPNDGQVLRIVP